MLASIFAGKIKVINFNLTHYLTKPLGGNAADISWSS